MAGALLDIKFELLDVDKEVVFQPLTASRSWLLSELCASEFSKTSSVQVFTQAPNAPAGAPSFDKEVGWFVRQRTFAHV